MPKMHLRQLDLHLVLVDHLQKNKERIKKFKETEDSRYVYQNELDKACFEHDAACGDFKDLTRASDKILCNKAFILLKIRNMMDNKGVLLQWFINFLIKNFCRSN